MNIFKYISFLLIMIISLLSSCAKMDAPSEVQADYVSEVSITGVSKMTTSTDGDSTEGAITDPDNDEDHDRDELSNKN